MTTEDQELKKAGLKVTLPRVKILQILENCPDRHMTAEDIYQSLRDADEDVGIATVYRVLTQFETAGLIERHNFDNGPAVLSLTGVSTTIIWCVPIPDWLLNFTMKKLNSCRRKLPEKRAMNWLATVWYST